MDREIVNSTLFQLKKKFLLPVPSPTAGRLRGRCSALLGAVHTPPGQFPAIRAVGTATALRAKHLKSSNGSFTALVYGGH